MTASVFRNWFTNQFLPYIEPHSVIVMDNASVHSVIVDKAPSSNTRKSDIMTWLSKRNITHSSSQTRTELLQLVKMHKPACNTYEIDSIAREHGHRVVRLPPYHCHYNPIELIWSQVKGYVADKNRTFKIADVEKLTHEAIDSVTVAAWKSCVEHAEKIQQDDFERELRIDSVIEPVIINLRDSDFEEDSSEEDADYIDSMDQ